jgi:hypothetical protein
VRFLSIANGLRLILTIQLWAIMLGNSSELFVHQCANRELMDTLEDVLNSQRTAPIVRECLLGVLAAAAHAKSGTPYEPIFNTLWRKAEPAGMPDEVSLYPLYIDSFKC